MQNVTHFIKSMLAFSMLFLFGQQATHGQQIPIKRTHALSELSEDMLQTRRPATGVLNVVAIMVEFQPDSNRLTSGTGIFGENGMEGLPYMSNAEDVRIEPLPHNQQYFEAHLEFAKNYYEKSSDGQLTLNYQVLPDVYQLPRKMETYSPTGETFTNEKVAQLARDAWQQVEENGGFDATGLNPENTAFVIFHAGVGRDIELTGTSLDITPFDIPSLYLGKDNLGRLLDQPGFNGFSVNDGQFRVTNSMIIPRTESRRGEDITETEYVFSLSINGLLVASIGSHLGLPDLFNTETGDPAIGRFGLMDGAGFFAFNGLLPPEPSAWEKIYLGWETPFVIQTNGGEQEIELPAGSLDEPNSIAKYELSNTEYFLVENRHRDPNGNGVTFTIRQPDGTEVQQTFTNDAEDTSFVFQQADFDTLLQAGTFVDASNFDFSLPGGFFIQDKNDPSDDRLYNGGILIWHIDEAMIRAQLSNERVNADPWRRGVDLEEADGAQNIGPGIPGAINNTASFGTELDFWWSGNDSYTQLESGRRVSLYENRFGPDTYPDNESNSGAPSFFEFFEFSDILPVASFKLREVQPEHGLFRSGFTAELPEDNDYFTGDDEYYNYYPLSLTTYETATDTFLVIPSQSGAWAYNLSQPESAPYELTDVPVQQPFIGNELVLAEKPSAASDEINVVSLQWNSSMATFDTSWTATAPANLGFLSSNDGNTIHPDFTANGLNAADGSIIDLGNAPFQRSEVIGGEYAEAENNRVTFTALPSFTFNPQSTENRLYTGSILLGNRSLAYVFENDRFSLIDPEMSNPVSVLFEEEQAEWPAILDDAQVLRVDKIHNRITGENKIGGQQNFTPIDAPDGVRFIGSPLVADISGDATEYSTLVVGQDSLSLNIYAYSNRGKLMEGFPLYVGAVESADTQPIHPVIYNNHLYALSHDGVLKSWTLPNITNIQWGSRYGNAAWNKVSARVFADADNQASDFGVINGDETYNWPNPATDETNIRFEVAKPGGTVEITVITTSGRIIFEEQLDTPGGYPQEIQVNTQYWGSGGYIARVKATVNGKTETKLIKIGVVH
ncbi:T9SS type A sorting domain-containing protein [Gracilimonas mengyeensis]|uniref:M6 family metalloprotease domain-containing protein/Por secretion system C-terminal sorting domain-containing protein n=1 Tax=Gracilimonas mengyeensis TaxID=1302730 RepID=A0A521FF90_9BACT|nr:T9SS type A sorting domain-containing protein [Gracilimonas mengyeensis]SMO94876.1 M6 family metalloprotease domain-containing protein/Por secretion system C-terminal sorting domain-containing protein [Gracilimonas mengyeensis]